MANPDIIGTTEASDLLGINRTTLFRWVVAGRVTPTSRLAGPNGAYLFHRTDIERLKRELREPDGSAA